MTVADSMIARLDAMHDQEAGLYEQLFDFIDKLKSYADSVEFDSSWLGNSSITWNLGSSSDELRTVLTNDRPANTTITLVKPVIADAPDADSFDVSEIPNVAIPTFTGTLPLISIPERPTFALPSEPTAPSVSDVFVPTMPAYTLPTVPTLNVVQFPDVPTLQLPYFEESFPVRPDLLITQTEFSHTEPDYQNDVLDAVTAVLLSDINDGGFGITPADEEALYARQKDRIMAESANAERQVIQAFSARNFRLAPGTLVELVNSTLQDAKNKVAEANREVSVQRAELLRKAREFAITQGLSLNEMMVQYWGFKMGRLLDANKFTAEFSIRVVDLQIARYNAYVQAFGAYAQAYAERVRAVLAQTEIFKTQVDAAVAKQQANESLIRVYQAQIEAVNTIVNIYESEVRAAGLKVEIEKAKVSRFEAQIQAFVAQVESRKSQVEAYESAIRGELAKVDVFKAQVEAYESEVRAAATKADIHRANADNDIKRAELELRAYESQVEKFRAELAAETARVQAIVSRAQQNTDVFKSVVDGYKAIEDLDMQLTEMWAKLVDLDRQREIDKKQIALTDSLERSKLRLGALQSGTEAFSHAMDAIYNSMNGIAYTEE